MAGLESMVELVTMLLEGKTLTAQIIMRKYGKAHAFAKRRLDLLAELPGVIITKTGKAQALKLPKVLDHQPTVPMDVVAACLVSSLGSAFRRTHLKTHVDRVRAAIVSRSRDYHAAEHLDRKFWFVEGGGERALGRADNAFVEVVDAVLKSRKVAFEYVHFDGRKEHVSAEPLTLALHEHQFYVICQVGPKLHPFRFSRMNRVRLGAVFQYPPDGRYDPNNVFRDAFGIFIAAQDAPVDVKLRLSTAWQHYAVSHRWHDSQRESVNPDGTVELTLRAPICFELKRWVLWFGVDARVIEPAELRDWVAGQHREAAAQYDRARPTLASTKPRARRPSTRAAR